MTININSTPATSDQLTTIRTDIGAAATSGTLAQFAATTSAQLAGVISDETGTGSLVFANSPTLVTPALGTPASGTLTNATGLPLSTGVTGTLPVANGGTGLTAVGTALQVLRTNAGATALEFATLAGGGNAQTADPLSQFAATTSAQLAGVISDETGTGALVFANSPTLVTPALGTPASGTLTNCTGLPVSTGVSGLGTGVATFLATPSSLNLAGAVTDETGSGALVFGTSPTLTTPNLGTPSAATLTNATGLPLSTGVTGTLPVANGGTALTAIGTALQVLRVNAGATALEYATLSGGGNAQTADPLSQFAATTSAQLAGVISDETGTGALVFASSPTLVTPTLGVASATSVNKVAITAPATGSTLTIADGKTLTASNTLTFTGTDASSVAFGTGGTVLFSGGALGTPSSATLTNATGLPVSTGISGLGTGVATFLATPSSANLASAVADETGSGALVFATSPTLVTPALGTPASGTLTNCTGLPVSTGVSGLGTGVATFLATPSSANLRTALTDEDGDGALLFANSPATLSIGTNLVRATHGNRTLICDTAATHTVEDDTTGAWANGDVLYGVNTSAGNVVLQGDGTATVTAGAGQSLTVAAGGKWGLVRTGTNAWLGGYQTSGAGDALTTNPLSQFAATTSAQLAGVISDETGTGALVFANSPTLVTPALGTPASGVVTNLTGTASININGTVGATTPAAGTFTTLVAGSTTSLLLGTAGSAVGNIGFRNATSGTITLAPVTGALGTVTLSLPAATDTLVGRDTTDTLTNKTLTSPTLTTPVLGTPSSGTLTSCTGLPISTGVAGLGTGVATFLATPSSANLAAALTDETGTSLAVFNTDPTLVRPVVQLAAAPGTDDTYHGQVVTGINAGATIAQWDAVYLDATATEWLLADANGTGTFPARGLAVAASTDGAALTVIEDGVVRNDAWTWTQGGTIYLSATAGGLTQTAPSTSGDKVQIMGYALSADVMRVKPSPEYMTVT